MSTGTRLRRTIARRFNHGLSWLGYELRRAGVQPTLVQCAPDVPYVERPEYGPSNIETKLEMLRKTHVFECADILAVNRAVAALAQPAQRIAELGGGTGVFAVEAAKNAGVTIVCSELHEPTHTWAQQNRSRPNITYLNRPVCKDDGPFDLLVAIELVEHVFDFARFLANCTALAPRLLITTPNRARSPQHDTWGPPAYVKHVREWTAGEFYWVLRCFYEDVSLFGLTGEDESQLTRASVLDRAHQLIADCRRPHSEWVAFHESRRQCS